MPLNISQIKEFIILIMGPCFQFVAVYLLLIIFPTDIKLIKLYHYSILIFNLLPIYPLDGGKLMNLLLSIKVPFKLSLKLTIIISYLMIIIIVLMNYPYIYLNLIIMTFFLLYKVTKEYKEINYTYEKFILERYLYKYRFKKSIIINNPSKFHRNKRHLLKIGDKYYPETEYLEKIYKK